MEVSKRTEGRTVIEIRIVNLLLYKLKQSFLNLYLRNIHVLLIAGYEHGSTEASYWSDQESVPAKNRSYYR
jgi:hypothetical protein